MSYNYFSLLMSRIIVKNIPKFVSQKQLKEHFKDLGQITDCKVVKDQKGQSRKFAFVGFKDKNSAGLALKNYNKTYLGVSKILIQKAKTKDQLQNQKNNNRPAFKQDKSKKKRVQSEQKFNKYKKIVQQSVKKSWDDLLVPQIAVESNKNQKTKKQKKEQKKQQKQKQVSRPKKQVKNKEKQQPKTIKPPKLSQKNKKYISQPLGIDETRLYITNIPYHITQQEVKNQFSKFGNIKKVKVPMEYDGTAKGYAFITYQMPQEALRAFSQTDNKELFGRIIHVKPAVQDIGEIIKSGRQADFQQKNKQLYGDNIQQKTSFKKQKKKQMRQKLNDTTSWNTLFLNPNTILSSMSAKLGLTKSQILQSDDLAPKVALAEAQVVQETKQWMISQGLNIQFLKLDRELCQRSEKIILVKNLNYNTTQGDLKQLFDFYGIVNKILLAPNKAIGIVQFNTKQFAKNAFEKLQNVKFKNNFLYLQMAPVGMLKQQDVDKKIDNMQHQINEVEQISKVIYIKNLNFQTQQSSLTEFLSKIQEPKSTKIIRDKTGKSMGYGFAEFASNQSALKVIRKLQNQILDGHKLMLSISKKTVQMQKYQKIKELKQKISKQQAISTKLVVRNLAFQATKNEVRELFKHFGSIRQVRLPKKINGQHRGFGFVEFDTAQQAALAKQALSNSHLYGRKLVIEYQKGSQQK